MGVGQRYDYPTYDTYLDEYGGLHPTQYAELLGQEATRLELLGRYDELGLQIDELRIQRYAETAAQELRAQTSESAGEQTARYLKSGVLLSGTPALMIKDTYEQGAEDLLALAEAASYEAQQKVLAASIANQNARIQANQVYSEISRVLGLNDIYNRYLDDLNATHALLAQPGDQEGGGSDEDQQDQSNDSETTSSPWTNPGAGQDR